MTEEDLDADFHEKLKNAHLLSDDEKKKFINSRIKDMSDKKYWQ